MPGRATALIGERAERADVGDFAGQVFAQDPRAVADTGGVVGVIFHGGYLEGAYFGGGSASSIVDHIEHVARTVGDEFVALGSDWDGLIATPRDMPTCLELPRLVQLMLERGFSAERVQRVLGGNFLRALRLLRG